MRRPNKHISTQEEAQDDDKEENGKNSKSEGTKHLSSPKSYDITPIANDDTGKEKEEEKDKGRKQAKIKKKDISLPPGTYWLTRVVFLHSLGFLYGIGFLCSIHQNVGLMGEHGLLPTNVYMKFIEQRLGGRGKWEAVPTLFWLFPDQFSDQNLLLISWTGLILSTYLALTGMASMPIMISLWALYMSIVNVGQTWYSFGWESQLLETGFLAIYLTPYVIPSRFPKHLPSPRLCHWGYLWLLFRIMLGAGLIKIRGDPCWRDLTCMNYHYETQPNPNPLSWYFHHTSPTVHRIETLGNHVVELILPWLLLIPLRLPQHIGGLSQIIFQAILISSGNLAFLNWLTILPGIWALDDRFFAPFFSSSVRQQVLLREKEMKAMKDISIGRGIRLTLHLAVFLLISYKSIPVVQNLLSEKQIMNTSFDSLKIVGSYGAFGSITRERTEVIFKGTNATTFDDPDVDWLEYEFKCKPGALNRRSCLISPYHYRLDWLLWFAAFGNYQSHPWIIHLAVKLLQGDTLARSLIAFDPFEADNIRPTFIKADHYLYKFTQPGSPEAKQGQVWRRELRGTYFPPLNLANPSVRDFCRNYGWPIDWYVGL